MSIYLLALIPSEKLQQEIKSFKEEVKERFGAKHALKLPAHITLHKPFKLSEEKEGDLIDNLTNFSEEQQPFKLKLSNFGRFDQRVIYVRVENKAPVIELAERLQNKISKFIADPEKEKLHPHLTIATRDLNKKIFPEAWNSFQERNYSAIFDVRNISLLKHDGAKWNLLQEFPLGSNENSDQNN